MKIQYRQTADNDLMQIVDGREVGTLGINLPPDTAALFARAPEMEEEIATLRSERNAREEVCWFAVEMEKTLLQNEDKGGWDDCDIGWLLMRLKEEVHELEYECNYVGTKDFDPSDVLAEATDVANLAMMLADVVRKRSIILAAVEAAKEGE